MAEVSDNPLSELFAMVAEEQKKQEKEIVALDQLSNFVESLEVVRKEKPQIVQEDVVTINDVSSRLEEMVEKVKEQAIAEIKEQKDLFGTSQTAQTQDPLTPFNQKFATIEDVQKHYSQFLTRIQQQLASIGGGGEVNFRYLDDVNRGTMTPSNDNWVLEYDAATKKAQFTNEIGPIELVQFNILHDVSTHNHEVGTLCWNEDDQTLNLFHPNGVIQQVGQELYGYVRNNTGSTIPNGTVVQFAGAEQNGTSRLEIAPFLADGTFPSLYTLGITTEEFADGEDGRVTIWGKVREINASGTGVTPTETWNVGDILYAHPTDVGKLTKVKPTTPSNVVPIAAVINNSATEGEIFVRPTIEQRYDYATVSSTQTQTLVLANTPQEITFNTIQNNLGVNIDGADPTRVVFTQSGLFTLDFNAQVLSNNSSKKEIYFWFRKNGVDIPFSTRIKSITGNGVYSSFHVAYNVSVDANDYIQIMWAGNDTSLELEAGPALAFAPESPSVYLHIDQTAL